MRRCTSVSARPSTAARVPAPLRPVLLPALRAPTRVAPFPSSAPSSCFSRLAPRALFHSGFPLRVAQQPPAAKSGPAPASSVIGGNDPMLERIGKDVKSDKVVLFMKGTPEQPMCGFSAYVVKVLQAENVPFTAYNVLEAAELREGIKKFTGWPTIPQLFVLGEFVGGADLTKDMYKSGELTELLLKAGLQPESAK